ncbi:MAG: hypothetical protein J6T10_14765 [Methanobrevibacter sp.]|nr:hypothetical protein [Methanobrevibacter sp.]
MTNKDKYLKDEVDVEEFIRDITDNIGIVVTTSDITKLVRISIYADDFQKFLNTPIKPTLTEDEKVILRNACLLSYVPHFISRNYTKQLYLEYEDENGRHKHEYNGYNHLFQFIQPRRRI